MKNVNYNISKKINLIKYDATKFSTIGIENNLLFWHAKKSISSITDNIRIIHHFLYRKKYPITIYEKIKLFIFRFIWNLLNKVLPL